MELIWTEMCGQCKIHTRFQKCSKKVIVNYFTNFLGFFFLFCFLQCWELNPGYYACWVSILPLSYTPSLHINNFLYSLQIEMMFQIYWIKWNVFQINFTHSCVFNVAAKNLKCGVSGSHYIYFGRWHPVKSVLLSVQFKYSKHLEFSCYWLIFSFCSCSFVLFLRILKDYKRKR
jgi:hypothetical protein